MIEENQNRRKPKVNAAEGKREFDRYLKASFNTSTTVHLPAESEDKSVAITKQGYSLNFVGPSGSVVVELFLWFPRPYRSEFDPEDPVTQQRLLEKPFQRSGELKKLSKELGYFGFSNIGEKYQSRRLVLSDEHLSYSTKSDVKPIFSIPLRGATCEYQTRGTPRRTDAFDPMNLTHSEEYFGKLSVDSLCIHKPADWKLSAASSSSKPKWFPGYYLYRCRDARTRARQLC